jgi:dUTP pyrophosphatase
LKVESGMKIKIKKLDPDAKIPSYAHPGDAGMDMFANETVTVEPGQSVKIRTGVAMEIPEGHVGLMWDKSGLSVNHGLKVLGGVIDSGYRGESLLGVINLSKVPYTFEKGHKVCQMLIQKVENPEIEEVEGLTDTSRGEGGFGSTGK